MFGSREDMQTAERLIAQFDELEKTKTHQEKAKEIAEAVRTPREKLKEVIGQYKDMLVHHDDQARPPSTVPSIWPGTTSSVRSISLP